MLIPVSQMPLQESKRHLVNPESHLHRNIEPPHSFSFKIAYFPSLDRSKVLLDHKTCVFHFFKPQRIVLFFVRFILVDFRNFLLSSSFYSYYPVLAGFSGFLRFVMINLVLEFFLALSLLGFVELLGGFELF